MKQNKLTIHINKPVSEVFEYTTNPDNTHKWIQFVGKEIASEYPPQIGTVYKNRGLNESDKWNEYKVTEFEQDKVFTLSSTSLPFHVRYTYTPLSNNSCELEYYEWVEEGEIEEPFPKSELDKLKNLLEQ